MTFRTQLSLEPYNNQITYASDVFSIGSCFSTSIGQKMANLRYNIVQNPAGITFNPSSILSTIRACISGDSLPEENLFFHNGMWSHPDFHGSYNHPDKHTYLTYTQSAINVASQHLKKTSYIIITLGTAFVFVDKKTKAVVNNCHKRPADDFDRKLLSIKDITNTLSSIIKLIDDFASLPIQYIITVSPVRHIRDGLVENLRSKSRLIEAIHQVTELHNSAAYFPAYEFLMDDLRDYRFYKSDMIHPTELAVEYIYNQFEKVWLSYEEKPIRQAVTNINNELNHRPIYPESEAHKKFQKSLVNKMNQLMSKYAMIDFREEVRELEQLIQSA